MENNEHQSAARNLLSKIEGCSAGKQRHGSMALVCRLIEEVEDEFCPLPRETPPPRFRFTGRMYAPQPDRMTVSENGSITAETRRHLIHCFADGGIRITNADEEINVLIKDGRR